MKQKLILFTTLLSITSACAYKDVSIDLPEVINSKNLIIELSDGSELLLVEGALVNSTQYITANHDGQSALPDTEVMSGATCDNPPEGALDWYFKGCEVMGEFIDAFDAKFSQGYGNYTTPVSNRPLRYLNDGQGNIRIQETVPREGKPLRPKTIDGVVQYTMSYDITYDKQAQQYKVKTRQVKSAEAPHLSAAVSSSVFGHHNNGTLVVEIENLTNYTIQSLRVEVMGEGRVIGAWLSNGDTNRQDNVIDINLTGDFLKPNSKKSVTIQFSVLTQEILDGTIFKLEVK